MDFIGFHWNLHENIKNTMFTLRLDGFLEVIQLQATSILDRTKLLVGVLTKGVKTQRIFKNSLEEFFGATDIYALNGNAIAHFINEGDVNFNTWEPTERFMPHEVVGHARNFTVLVACQ